MTRTTVLLSALLLAWAPALAQESPSHKLEEHVLNAGGVPLDGTVLSSPSHRMKVGAVGRGLSFAGPASASHLMAPGFVTAYPPPGEVTDLRFLDATTLAWDAERSAGVYNLYQAGITSPFDTGYGACTSSGLPANSTTVTAAPAPGGGLFFLVTADNRLAEEGTKGTDSTGLERGNPSPCP